MQLSHPHAGPRSTATASSKLRYWAKFHRLCSVLETIAKRAVLARASVLNQAGLGIGNALFRGTAYVLLITPPHPLTG